MSDVNGQNGFPVFNVFIFCHFHRLASHSWHQSFDVCDTGPCRSNKVYFILSESIIQHLLIASYHKQCCGIKRTECIPLRWGDFPHRVFLHYEKK